MKTLDPTAIVHTARVTSELERLVERVIERELTRDEHKRVRWYLGPNKEVQFDFDGETFGVKEV